MREIHLSSLTVNLKYYTDTFHPSLTVYIYYINILCQLNVGKK